MFTFCLVWCCSIVCVGGDGTVHRVINHLLNKQQRESGTEMTPHLTPLKLRPKIGIIPTGSPPRSTVECFPSGIADPLFLQVLLTR